MSIAAPILMSGFLAGLIQPLTATVHVIALLGLGLMIGQQTRRGATLGAFALGLAAGLAALAAATGETSAPLVILAGAAAAGLAAASGAPMPSVVGAPLALIIGAAIGLDSPPRVGSIAAANAALAGTALTAFAMVAILAAIAAWLRRGWPRIGARVLGSWVAASAIFVLALRLAQ